MPPFKIHSSFRTTNVKSFKNTKSTHFKKCLSLWFPYDFWNEYITVIINNTKIFGTIYQKPMNTKPEKGCDALLGKHNIINISLMGGFRDILWCVAYMLGSIFLNSAIRPDGRAMIRWTYMITQDVQFEFLQSELTMPNTFNLFLYDNDTGIDWQKLSITTELIRV